MNQSRLGISSIAARLRLVLFTVALLIILLPTIVNYATGQLIDRQEEASSNLIESEFRETRLIRELNRIAGEARNITFLQRIDQVRSATGTLISDVDALGQALSDPDGGAAANANAILTQLDAYQAVVAKVADIQIEQLDAEARLASQTLDAREEVGAMLALLETELVAQKIALDRDISALAASNDAATASRVQRTFSDLLTLNSIADAAEGERLFIASIGQNIEGIRPHRLQVRSKLVIQNLATQIAKLQRGPTQTALAERAIATSDIMLGTDGIFDQIARLQNARAEGQAGLDEQKVLTDGLLELARGQTEGTYQDVVAASQQAQALVVRARTATILITGLASLLIIGVLVIVVERQFNRRIGRLTRRVLAIAKDEPDVVGAVPEGNDELSAMNGALEVFKSNAAALRDANASLAMRNSEVRQLGTRLETVLDTASSGILAFDKEGRIILANRPARHFLGGISDPAPFDRPPDVTFLDRENLAPLDASSDPINRVLAGQILNHEIALMERVGVGDGRYVRLTSNRVEDPGSTVRMVLAIDDVSDAEQNRQQIERASRLDALGQLTGGIAHDFNNLLATIQYAVQLAADGDDPKSREEYTKVALDSVERGAQLSGRLLSFAKRQPGKSRSHSVEKLLEDFKVLVGPTIESAIKINFRIDDPDMSVFCDDAQLENALLNLVLNARDAILREGVGNEITVAARSVTELRSPGTERNTEADRYPGTVLEAELRHQEEGGIGQSYRYVEFSISDNGPGMTDAIKRRALDPFFTTKSTNSGTGLGLSMVYGFVQQSGGELRIYTEPGQGTTMRLILPRGSDLDEREGPMERHVPIAGDGQLILLAEDEKPLREALEDMIVSFGYTVRSVDSGKAALKLVEEGEAFDLLLTDIVMPGGISGFELAAEVRKMRPDVPILYMSGYAAYTDREMGHVIAPLLQKPCSPRALAENLRDALAAEPSDAFIECGPPAQA